MQATLTTRQHTIVLDDVLTYQQLQDGRWEVQPGPNGARVLAMTALDGGLGSAVNVSATVDAYVPGMRQPSPESRLRVGDVLLVASTLPGSQQCDDMVSIHFVSWPANANHLTGPAIGSPGVYEINYLRTRHPIHRFPLAAAANLPTTVDLRGLGVTNVPTIEWWLSKMIAAYDVPNSWGATGSPVHLHRYYGQNFAGMVSIAALLLVSKESAAAKAALASRVMQMTLDVAGAFLDGRVQGVDGGHYLGRQALLLLGMTLLGVDQSEWGRVFKGQFAEDRAFPLLGPLSWAPDWTYGYRGHEGRSRTDWVADPSTWSRDRGGPHWYAGSYLHGAIGPQIGSALILDKLGLGSYCSGLVGMAKQWMQGPSSTGAQVLAANGVVPGFGNDYLIELGSGIAAAAWRRYA